MYASHSAFPFSRRLYCDHLEEIEFLLAQRLGLFHDAEVQWPQIEDFEQRLTAHVDGIILGGKDADGLAIELLESDDIDTVRGAAFALAHSKFPEALGSVIAQMEQAPAELLPAYVEALKHPPNDHISEKLSPLLSHENSKVRTAAITILGYRREGDPAQIASGLRDSDPSVAEAAAVAVRRHGYANAVDQLRQAMEKPEPSLAIEAALALAVLGSNDGPNWLRRFCSESQDDLGEAPVYLALTGTLADSNLIARSPAADRRAGIEALGIIGDPESIHRLKAALNSDEENIKLAAAESIELITGSGLIEQYTHVEKLEDPDEGVIETEETVLQRVSTSIAVWSEWLDANRGGLTAGMRYRLGKPFALSSLIDEIADPLSVFTRRKRAYLELLVRTDHKPAFEPDWFIARQRSAIDLIVLLWQFR